MAVVGAVIVGGVVVSSVAYAVRKFREKCYTEMEALNIKNRMGIKKYLAHEKEIIKAKETLDISEYNFNFGIAGYVKTGKSSLINALRGLNPTDPDAAPVGITEQTKKPTRYNFSPFVKIYDIPGSGTIDHPSKNYFFQNGLCMLDVLIIVVQQTVTKKEINLARKAMKYRVPVIFVKSKMDFLFDCAVNDGKVEANNQEAANRFLKKMKTLHKQYMLEKVLDLIHIPIFHISSKTIYKMVNFINRRLDGTSSNEMCSLVRKILIFEEKEFFDELIKLSNKRVVEQTRTTSTNDILNIVWNSTSLHDHHNIEEPTGRNTRPSNLITDSNQQNLHREANLCCICLENTPETAFMPCRHMVVCQQCSKNLFICPICRADISYCLRIYQS